MIKLGENSIGKVFFGNNEIAKAYLGSDLVYQKGGGGGGVLPSGYKRLTYVENPLYSQAYIDTGISTSNNIGFEIDAMTYDPIGNSVFGCLFGGRAGSNQSDFQLSTFIARNSSFGGTLRIGEDAQNYDAHLTRIIRFQASLNGTTFTINDTDYTVSHNISSGRNIYLFALNNDGVAAQFGHLRIYYFKLTSNGDTVLEYIPCRRRSDGVVGFYDLVAEAFVAPSSGALCGVNETTETGEENNFTWGKGGINNPGQSSGSTNPVMSMVGQPLEKTIDPISLICSNGYTIRAIFISQNATSPTKTSEGTYLEFSETPKSISIPQNTWYEVALYKEDGGNADISVGYKSLLVK